MNYNFPNLKVTLSKTKDELVEGEDNKLKLADLEFIKDVPPKKMKPSVLQAMNEAAENMVIMNSHELGDLKESSFAESVVSNFIFLRKMFQEELLRIAHALFWLFLETWWEQLAVPKTLAASFRQ